MAGSQWPTAAGLSQACARDHSPEQQDPRLLSTHVLHFFLLPLFTALSFLASPLPFFLSLSSSLSLFPLLHPLLPIHPPTQYILWTSYMPDTVLNPGDTAVTKTLLSSRNMMDN